MSTREANNDSHLLKVPLSQNAKGKLTTTVQCGTQENHGSDTNVSTDALCGCIASVPHAGVHGSVSLADGTNTALPILPNPFAPVLVSRPGAVTAVDAPAPVPTAAVTSNSNPTRDHPTFPPCVSENCGDVSASSFFSSVDPGMSGFADNFEVEIAILEAQWARDGISMNATTFFTEAVNSISPASSSTA